MRRSSHSVRAMPASAPDEDRSRASSRTLPTVERAATPSTPSRQEFGSASTASTGVRPFATRPVTMSPAMVVFPGPALAGNRDGVSH
ncbi:MAG: hypothetical protein AB2L13_01455 [Spirochaetota bacterium]